MSSEHDLALTLLLVQVRKPDHNYSFAIGTHRLMWGCNHNDYVVVQFIRENWVIATPDAKGFRDLTFPELLSLFSDLAFRDKYGLNPDGK